MKEKSITDIQEAIGSTWTTILDFIKYIKLSHLISLFILFLLSLIVIDNLFSFSYNYRINQKLSQIEKIEVIKDNFPKVDLQKIENDIYERDTVFTVNNLIFFANNLWEITKKPLTFIPDGENNFSQTNTYNFTRFILYFVSIEFIWIFILLIWLFLLFSEDNRKIGYQLILISVWFWFIWYLLFIFINWLLWIQNIWWNFILNFIILFVLVFIWNNPNINTKNWNHVNK